MLSGLVDDTDFQKNLFTTQSNVLSALNTLSKTQSNSGLGDISQSLRTNMIQYESFLSPQLVTGQVFEQSTANFKMSIIKLPANPNDFKYMSPTLNLTFPLSTAVSPTSGPSFTIAGYKVSPFMGANLINQTLLTNTTVYFAYRDGNGNYLNNSYITGNIVMNFSFPLANKVKGTVTCAYAGPSDTYWRNDSCITKLYFGRDMI